MKILHIMNELRFSGAEMLLESGGAYFNQHGITNVVLSTGDDVGEFAENLKRAGFEIAHIPFSRSLRFFVNFANFLRLNGFDVVHCHSERANFWYGLLSSMFIRRVVRTVHNEFPFEGRLKIVRGLQRRMLYAAGVTFVACSARVALNERKRFGLNCEMIPNWLDPARVSLVSAESRQHARAKLDIEERELCIVSLGNYGPAKNHETIVAAVRLCAESFPIRYLHCGAGGEQLAQKMAVAVDEPVTFMGAVTDINEVLAASDAFVSASFFEGGQVSLLEAGKSGVVCITTRVGLAEELEGMANVVFIEPTVESLVEALSRLRPSSCSDRTSEAKELSEFISSRYTPAVGAAAYVCLYRA